MKRLIQWLHERVPDTSTAEIPISEETQAEARSAMKRAQSDLQEAQAQDEKVSSIVMALDDQRRRNHFGEMLEKSMWRPSHEH